MPAPRLSSIFHDFDNRCGDPHDDLLSVYPLKVGPLSGKRKNICEERKPHNIHGCVAETEIDWSHAHNVRNFSAANNDHNACIWECKDHHPRY